MGEPWGVAARRTEALPPEAAVKTRCARGGDRASTWRIGGMGGPVPHAVVKPLKESPDRLTPGASTQGGLGATGWGLFPAQRVLGSRGGT